MSTTAYAWGDAATSTDVLARLASIGTGQLDATRLRRALLDAQLAVASDGGDRFAPVMAACEALGLRAQPARLPLADALRTVGGAQPLLVALAIDAAPLALVADRVGGRVRVERLPEGAAAWMPVDALAAAMGLADAASPADVLMIESAAPLGVPSVGSTASHHHDGPGPTRRLASWMLGEKADLLTILVYALFVGLLGVVTPIAVQALVTTVTFGTLMQPLVVLALMVFGALAFAATLRALSIWVVEVVRRRFFARVATVLTLRLSRADRRALAESGGRELANRFFDVFAAQKAAVSLLVDGLDVVLTVVVGMLVLGFYHPLLLAFDVLLVLAVTTVVLFLGRHGARTAIAVSKKKYEAAAFFQELASGMAAHRLGAGPELAARDAELHAREWLAARAEHYRIVFSQTASMLALQAIASAALVGVGGFLVIGRQLTLGQLVAAELIVTTVVAALAKVGKHLETYYELLASLDKLGHLLDVTPDEPGPLHAGHGPLAVSLEDVPTIAGRRASLLIESGRKVVVRVPSADERARIADLLTTLGRADGGRVALGHLDRHDLDLESLRRRIALVREDDFVRASILENVRVGRPASVAAVREVLTQVGLIAAVDALPEHLETILGDGGRPLDANERVRLVIARALVSGADLVVIDGALDRLPATEASALVDLLARSDATLVVLTSDASLVAHPALAVRGLGRGGDA